MQFINYTKSSIVPPLKSRSKLSDDFIKSVFAAAQVFPMRANNYVVDNLIDWDNPRNDPLFKLTFPQPELLQEEDLSSLIDIINHDPTLECKNTREKIRRHAIKIRKKMNPHPAKQKELNVPRILDPKNKKLVQVPGIQHKYRETVLFFASEAQWCHAYCTYCFRWAQFTEVGSEQQFRSHDIDLLTEYIKENKQVTDILFTGGDPGVMKTKSWLKYLNPILENEECDHLNTIRIGTKSLSYWPYRYTHNNDSKQLLEMFENIAKKGKHVTIQAHFTHPNEMQTKQFEDSVKVLRMAGCNIRSQGPLVKNINDDSNIWLNMWNKQLTLGIIPYYMFIERDTGPKHYFEVPLVRGFDIFKTAYSKLSGIGRTVRGPSMSCDAGKVSIQGVLGDMMILQFLQARNPEWCRNPFFAKLNPKASWIDDLQPYDGAKEFFYEKTLKQMEKMNVSSGQMDDETINACGNGIKHENDMFQFVTKNNGRLMRSKSFKE